MDIVWPSFPASILLTPSPHIKLFVAVSLRWYGLWHLAAGVGFCFYASFPLSADRSPGHRWDLINVCQGNRSAGGRTTQRPRWESVRMEHISCQIRKLSSWLIEPADFGNGAYGLSSIAIAFIWLDRIFSYSHTASLFLTDMVHSTLMFSFSCCYISLDRHNF